MNKVTQKITKQAKGATKEAVKEAQTFSHGFFAPLHSAKFLLRFPELLRYTIFPLILNIFLFGLGLWWVFSRLPGVLQGMVPEGGGFWAVLAWILIVITLAVVLVLTFVLFAVVARIIAAPFNEQLSKATEALHHKDIKHGLTEKEEKLSLKLVAEDAWRTIKEETQKLSLLIVIQVILIPLNIIPVAGNILYIILSTPIMWLFASYDTVDLPLARRGLSFKEKRQWIMKRKSMFFGFGLASTLLITIPIVNLLFMPILVVAGTMLYLETSSNQQ